jgi:hypothetical protein
MKCRYVRVTSPSKVRTMLRAGLAPVILDSAYRVAASWQRSIPHEWPGQDGHVTGNTARSITVRRVRQLTGAVGTASISGKSLEDGAEAHVIRPKRYRHNWKRRGGPGLLAWPDERGGAEMPTDPPGWRIRKVARHPGVSPRGYGRLALDRERPHLTAQLKAAIARMP